jgi:hypothetical protein
MLAGTGNTTRLVDEIIAKVALKVLLRKQTKSVLHKSLDQAAALVKWVLTNSFSKNTSTEKNRILNQLCGNKQKQ